MMYVLELSTVSPGPGLTMNWIVAVPEFSDVTVPAEGPYPSAGLVLTT